MKYFWYGPLAQLVEQLTLNHLPSYVEVCLLKLICRGFNEVYLVDNLQAILLPTICQQNDRFFFNSNRSKTCHSILIKSFLLFIF
ncbi:hypothetical protein BH748_14820 [Enterococcus casseliflavus]|nr:hypothetical protein BH748_14820 [Enterococcus casseliflavus]